MSYGIAIVTYNRCAVLAESIQAVLDTTKPAAVIVCDDGSTDETSYVASQYPVTYIRGPRKGVCWNKNRGLVSLQHLDYICILEDDLIPTESGWMETYIDAAEYSGTHHFCRVQDKEVDETVPDFSKAMTEKGFTPLFGPSARGDLTFITKRVIREMGGFHPDFIGVGYGHQEWSARVVNAGLIPHPLKWVDIKEARDLFVQKGDTEGGRWNDPKETQKQDLKRNRAIQRRLKATGYIYCPLRMV